MRKYLFPLNFDYSNKIFGIFDYKLSAVLLIFGFVLFQILSLFSFSIFTKIIIFITIFLPLFLLLNSTINHEPFYLFILSVIIHKITAKKYISK